MAKRITWGHALTAIGLVGALAACSNPQSSANSASAFKVDPSKIGIATRAQAALQANDLPTALELGEAAVAYRPTEASFRALLGNIYLASGRYASAETAYHDALTLAQPDPQIILKYVLVQIARGKHEQAIAMLGEAQPFLDPADVGLALALAGRTEDAVAILTPAARQRGADARVRQNLAFAHALDGNWEQSRIVAQQDLAADQVDARMAEWLAMARPGQASAQVAAFIGVQPALSDPGQPIRLALNAAPDTVRQAAVTQTVPAPVAFAAPAPAVPVMATPTPAAPEKVAAYEPAVSYQAAPAYEPTPVQVAQPPSVAPPLPVASVAPPTATPARRSAPQKVAARAPRPGLTPAAIRLSSSLGALRRNAALRVGNGRSRAVVQLGAYDSRAYIAGAWTRISGRHAALRDYTPVTARYEGAKGTFYRLSVKGFTSDRQAIDLCNSLKRSGAKCFVRAAFNDAPVQLASR